MPTADERQKKDFRVLVLFAEELAETWRNGNRTDVIDILSDPARTDHCAELALFIAESLRISGDSCAADLGRALFVCKWEA